MAHGQERDLDRLRDYVRTEMNMLRERCDRLSDELAAMRRRLDVAEGMADRAFAQGGDGTVQSGAKILT